MFSSSLFQWVSSLCTAHLLVIPSKCVTFVLFGSFGFFILRSSGHTVFSCNTPVPTKCLNFGLSAHPINAYLLHDLSTQSAVLLCSKSIPDQLHLLSPNYMIVPLLEQLVITGEGCDGFFGIF